MYVLLVDRENDYEPPDVHGPFATVEETKAYAEKFRAANGLPVEATPKNNDEWTDAGWYFGIFEPQKVDFS